MADFNAGYEAIVKMDDTTGTPRSFVGYVSSSEVSYEQDMASFGVLGTKGKRKVALLDDASVSIEGPWHSQIEAWVGAPSTWGTKRTFEVQPTGSETGERDQSFEAFIKSYKVSTPADAESTFSLELEKDADATWGTNA